MASADYDQPRLLPHAAQTTACRLHRHLTCFHPSKTVARYPKHMRPPTKLPRTSSIVSMTMLVYVLNVSARALQYGFTCIQMLQSDIRHKNCRTSSYLKSLTCMGPAEQRPCCANSPSSKDGEHMQCSIIHHNRMCPICQQCEHT